MSTISEMVDIEEVTRDWKRRGFECAVWEDVPGHKWCDYRHETDELFMVLDGHVEVEIEGETKCPEVGEEICIPAGKHHTVRNVGQSRCRWLHGCWSDYPQTD